MTREQAEPSYGRVTDRRPVRWGAVAASSLLAVAALAAKAPTAGAEAAATAQSSAPFSSVVAQSTGPIAIEGLGFVNFVNASGAVVTSPAPGDEAVFRYTLRNTGTDNLDVTGVTDVSHPMEPDCSGPLAAGGTRTCTAIYALTKADVDTTGSITANLTASATTADGAAVGDATATSSAQSIPESSGIKVELSVSIAEKDQGVAGKVEDGEVVSYTMDVTNKGNVTLTLTATPVTLTVRGASHTPVICPSGRTTLDAGASMTCTATKVLVTADIAGTMTNIAQATGTPVRPTGATAVTHSDEVSVLMTEIASITIQKQTTLIDEVEPGRVDADDKVKYTYTVTNGPVPVVGIEVEDAVLGTITCLKTLPASQSLTCSKTITLTQDQVDAGIDVGPNPVADAGKVTVTANPTGRAEVTHSVTAKRVLDPAASLTLKRTEKVNTAVAAPAGRADARDEVTFTFTVVNTGNVTLSGVGVTAPDDEQVACTPAVLAPTATATCSKVVVLTSEQVTAGALGAGTATARTPKNAQESGSDGARTSLGGVASIMVDRTATVRDAVAVPAGRVDAGDQVVYSYTVRNSGNLALMSVALTDTLRGPIRCPKTLLGPGESMKCSQAVVRLSQVHVDAGTLSSTATATASPSRRSSVTGSDIEETTLPAAPAVVLDKVSNAIGKNVKPGDRVFYSFRATNTGNVTLTEVSVSYPDVGKVICPKRALAPKASTTCTAVYRVTQADIDEGVISNTVTVGVKAPDERTLTAEGAVSFSVAVGRRSGKDRFSTAAQISEETFSPGVKAVYIATGANFPDALAGSAASGGAGPILLVSKDTIPEATLAELKRLRPKRIVVLGGTGVVSRAVETTLRRHGTTSRQSGRDRYSTAAQISARHFNSGVPVVYVATGENYPDALTGGPAAAKLGGPILLTRKDTVPAATESELKRLKPKRIVVLGGTGVVSRAVEKALKGHTSGAVTRLAGADRYGTGAAISRNAYKPGVPIVYIATGVNFPDALAGGAAGALDDGPVLLVSGASIPKATRDELTRLKPKRIVVLGGTAAVPQSVRQALDAYIP